MEEVNIEYIKEKVKSKLTEIKGSMSTTRYKLYCAMVADCKTLEEVTDICEVKLPIEVHKYVRDVIGELETLGTSVDEI